MKPKKGLIAGVSALAAGLILSPAVFAQPSHDFSGAAFAQNDTGTTSSAPENNGTANQQSTASSIKEKTVSAYHTAKRDAKDLAMEAKVKMLLHEMKGIDASDVHVTANSGIVTLRGQVASLDSAVHAQNSISRLEGVKSVRNYLTYPANTAERDTDKTVPNDSVSTGVAHPAYRDTAPAERTPGNNE